MRFTGETQGLEYIKKKIVRDPNNYSLEIAMPASAVECQRYFNDWIDAKRYMFSPQEYESLKNKQRPLQTVLLRNHYINAFADWAEQQPRRRAIIIVKSARRKAANAIAKQIDVIGGGQTFSGLGLSPSGEKPATHYWCNWNCSASEYKFFGSINQSWWQLFDGQREDGIEVLSRLNLKSITLVV